MMRFGHVLVVVLFAVCTAAQEFPFKNGPLDPSLHSNKIFFETESIDDIAGVWKPISIVMHAILQKPELFSGGVPLNEICQRAGEEGLFYRYEKVAPQDAIILPAKEEGELGRVIDTRVHRFDERIITGWSDGVMRFDQEDLCRTWRPYFDWEVGKAMFLRTRRFALYEDENGEIASTSDVCVYGGIDHPFCAEGSFIIDGQEVNGVMLDAVMYYECVAGPCLELPHTLPGYVKTQGWQPRE